MLREGGGSPLPPCGPWTACVYQSGLSPVPYREPPSCRRVHSGTPSPASLLPFCSLRPGLAPPGRDYRVGLLARRAPFAAPRHCACAESWSARARVLALVRARSLVTRGLRRSSGLAGPAARGEGEARCFHGDGPGSPPGRWPAEPRPGNYRQRLRQAGVRLARGAPGRPHPLRSAGGRCHVLSPRAGGRVWRGKAGRVVSGKEARPDQASDREVRLGARVC